MAPANGQQTAVTAIDPLLRCPRCAGALRRAEAGAECAACGAEFELAEGILDLRCHRKDYYFNPVPRPRMRELIDASWAQPWHATIRGFLRQVGQNPDWLDNLTAHGRYAWKLFLDLPPTARVLDLGCGLGNLTQNLAPQVGRVYAMDLTYERLLFARRRFALFNPDDDIRLLAAGDGQYLPFADAGLDAVVLSGVLEWVPDDSRWEGGTTRLTKAWRMVMSQFGDGNPRQVQLRFLKEIRRILKADGQLFVAIENRLNYEYFGGRPDHHSGLKYGSLMPRLAANFYSIAANRRPYRTYTYAKGGYERLLAEAGFGHRQFLGLSPGYSKLAEVIPLQVDEARWQVPARSGLAERIRRNPYLVPAYGIIAGSAAAGSLIGRLVREIERQSGREPLILSCCTVTARNKAVLLGALDGREVVLRIPFGENAAAGERRALALKAALGTRPGAALVPRVLCAGRVQNLDYCIEEAAPGRPLASLLAQDPGARSTLLPAVVEMLRAFNPALAEQQAVPLAGGLYERVVGAPLRRLRDVLEDGELVARAETLFRDAVHGMEVRPGLAHGDLSISNVFIDDGRVSAVIDWEDAALEGLPILDAFNYVDSVARGVDRLDLAQTVTMLADGWPRADEAGFLAAACDALGADPQRRAELAALYWLRHVSAQAEHSLAHSTSAVDRRVRAVLAVLVERLALSRVA